ncbi:unnamed protein product [Lasius platythorax]|uniref:Uncharacterized protein n=1 Tax=Lasius platythorax TaxID=488582 RepID=A0AAV2NXV1_9HYME
MPHDRKRKRSRSRSRDRRISKEKTEEKLNNMQTQLDNLTNILTQLIQPTDKIENKENLANEAIIVPEEKDLSQNNKDILQDKVNNGPTIPEEVLQILGEDPNSTKEIAVKFHPELKRRWEKWMQEGFPEENKKVTLQKYPRKQELYTEAPKVNLEITPIMSEIAVKRDQHFLETQNCVGSAISALAAAISLILEDPEDGIDQESFTEFLCDAGKLLTRLRVGRRVRHRVAHQRRNREGKSSSGSS